MVSRVNKKQNDNILYLTHVTILNVRNLIRQIDGVYGAERLTEKTGKPV